MSLCRFEFPFQIASESLIQQIRTRVQGAGGRFEGSTTDGSFHLPTALGEFKGYYQIAGSVLLLEVTDKPFFVPCSAIETRLRDYVNRG